MSLPGSRPLVGGMLENAAAQLPVGSTRSGLLREEELCVSQSQSIVLGKPARGLQPLQSCGQDTSGSSGGFVLQGCGNGQALVAPRVTRGHSLSRKEQLQPRARGSAGACSSSASRVKKGKATAPRHGVMGTWRGGRAMERGNCPQQRRATSNSAVQEPCLAPERL